MKTIIIPTTSAFHLIEGMSKNTDFEVILPDKNKDSKYHFPDGETYIRLSKINEINNKIIILHSGMPNPNQGLMELEIMLQILKDKHLEVFFTYFSYGMQDKVFEEGESNIAEELIKKLVNYYNVKKIYILDAHFHGEKWVEKYPIVNISAVNLLKEKASSSYKDILYLAPDLGSQRRTGLKGVNKKRKNSFLVEIQSSEEFKTIVKDKTIGVVDDILETGGTMSKFHDECINNGANKVIALITHGVLKEGIERIKMKYAQLYLTNSINNQESNIDITNLIINSIRN